MNQPERDGWTLPTSPSGRLRVNNLYSSKPQTRPLPTNLGFSSGNTIASTYPSRYPIIDCNSDRVENLIQFQHIPTRKRSPPLPTLSDKHIHVSMIALRQTHTGLSQEKKKVEPTQNLHLFKLCSVIFPEWQIPHAGTDKKKKKEVRREGGKREGGKNDNWFLTLVSVSMTLPSTKPF